MKKWIVFLLVILLLAVPVLGAGNLVNDGEGLLTNSEVLELEQHYEMYAETYGFTPILVTTDGFGGHSAESYAGIWYDSNSYPEDGILLLVSLSEGQWYILTNGACYDRISNGDAEWIGQQLVSDLRAGNYYDTFIRFPKLAEEAFNDNVGNSGAANRQKNYVKTIIISMAVGLGIGAIAAGVMAAQMKSVKAQRGAADYVRSGSMNLHSSRDIFLYSRVSRTPKPKSNSSGGRSGGGGRGSAGGRI